MDERFCNCCGKKLGKRSEEDAMEVIKEWGYFSGKDLERHAFILCEGCYDKWIGTFVRPVKKSEVTEAM